MATQLSKIDSIHVYDPTYDLDVLEAMVGAFTPYVYEEPLYGTISADLPEMTMGGLLLHLRRLETLTESLTYSQRQRLLNLRIDFLENRSEWHLHYVKKVLAEVESRMYQIGNFLADFEEDPEQNIQNYRPEANRRTIVYHLREEALALGVWDDAHAVMLLRIDNKLRRILPVGNYRFIWSEDLQPAYPETIFWWLYRLPVERNRS